MSLVKLKMSDFYKKAAKYWANVPATIDGVLGGFSHISDTDIAGSEAFLNHILCTEKSPAKKLALDCGAGIGRVSKFLLIPHFEKVDLVEQDAKFINTAKEFIGKDNVKLGSLYNVGLQEFKPKKKYDVIWIQWVLGHLKDYDLVAFLKRCKKALAKDGVIVVKENIATGAEIEYDAQDSSVTRPNKLMKMIFEKAELQIILECHETDLPEDNYPVYMFALVSKMLK